jgi:hypothetical protein
MGNKNMRTTRSKKNTSKENGDGSLHNGFHGDPSRGNSFWEYLKHRNLVTLRWDTHNAKKFCTNASFVRNVGNGVKQYICNGHGSKGVLSEEDLEQRLVQLASMGFTDRTRAAEYLREYDGDLDSAIEAFLSADSSPSSFSSSSPLLLPLLLFNGHQKQNVITSRSTSSIFNVYSGSLDRSC